MTSADFAVKKDIGTYLYILRKNDCPELRRDRYESFYKENEEEEVVLQVNHLLVHPLLVLRRKSMTLFIQENKKT